MGERFPDVDWYCDRCGEHLNGQAGFDDHRYTWPCEACGHKNSISRPTSTSRMRTSKLSVTSMRRCSRCGEPGHNIQTCPVPPGHPVVLAVDLSKGYGQWRPNCAECGWEGSWHTDRSEAQGEAMSHHNETRG